MAWRHTSSACADMIYTTVRVPVPCLGLGASRLVDAHACIDQVREAHHAGSCSIYAHTYPPLTHVTNVFPNNSEPAAPEPEPEQERPRSSTPPGGAKRPSVPKRPTKLEVLYSFDADQEGDLELAVCGDHVGSSLLWCVGAVDRLATVGPATGGLGVKRRIART